MNQVKLAGHIVVFLFAVFGEMNLLAQESDSEGIQDAPFIPGVVISDGSEFENLTSDSFRRAARNGDLEKVKAALESGLDVDSKSAYGATALFFACDRGQAEVVDFLLKKGANPNVKDTFYESTPVSWAMMKGSKSIVLNLLKNGGDDADEILQNAVGSGDSDFVKELLDAKLVDEKALIASRDAATRLEDESVQKKILKLFEPLNLPPKEEFELTSEMLEKFVGEYGNDQVSAKVVIEDDKPMIGFNGGQTTELIALSLTEFTVGNGTIKFNVEDESDKSITCDFGTELVLPAKAAVAEVASDLPPRPKNVEELAAFDAEPKFGESSAESRAADLEISSSNWPGFRGSGSRGVADGQKPPTKFAVAEEVDSGESLNLIWKSPVPGLGLSCPTIWDDKIYLTSAVSEGADGSLKIGLYGDVESVEEENEYEFRVLCYSKDSGKLLWERTANKAKPAVKRHAKSSHANPTVATNGKHVVAFFGSEGLYCYASNGDLIWSRDFGLLDSGWFYDPGYQWGFASSPVIDGDRVIVQCDIQGESFVAALDLATGEEVWRTSREEIPSWSTPLVHQFEDKKMLITNGTKAARGYDADTGELLWSLSGNSEIVVPTPNVSNGLIYVSSGYSPIRPIYAIKPDAKGDLSLESSSTNEGVAWSKKRGGPYMPTPIIYGDYLYCCANNGILTCYQAKTGDVVYKKRMTADGGELAFTSSPIAADGYLYMTAEDGRVLVVKAGSEFEIVEVNQLNESILSTPAISEGAIYFRTQDSLIAVGERITD